MGVTEPPDVDTAYSSHVGFVRRVLVRCGVPIADAPDLAQEVFVVLLRRVEEHRDPATLRSWLFQTARRVASNYRRTHRRTQARIASLPPTEPAPSPEELVARREAASFVAGFLTELDEEARELFVLSELEGIGGTAIARRLNVNAKTTYSRVYALRRRFDREAAETFGHDPSQRTAAVVPWLVGGWSTTLRRGLALKAVAGVVVLALLVLAWRVLRPPSAPDPAPSPAAPASRWDPRHEDDLRQRLQASTLDTHGAEAILGGRVHDPSGRGVIGADVCVWRHAIDFSFTALGEPTCTRSGEDGTFRIAGVTPGLVRLTATAAGYVPAEHSRGSKTALRATEGERTGLDVEMHPGGVAFEGVVRDMLGGSVEGVMVALRAEPSVAGSDPITFGGWGDRPPVVVVSGEDGRFATSVAPGAVHWQAFADGYAATRGETTAPAREVVIRVVPEAVLSGVVRDATTGRPVANARVVAWADARSLTNAAGAVRSDADGRFRIDRLPPGRYKPWATAAGRIAFAPRSVGLGPGDSVDDIELTMIDAPIVTARVTVASSGEPCPDGVAGLREDGRGRMEWQVIGDDGEVVFPAVLPGSYRPVVACNGYQSLPFYAAVEAGTQPATDLSWVVTDGATVSGTVVRADGTPATGALVTLFQQDGPPLPRGARTDDAGRFAYPGLGAGTYRLSASSGGEVVPEDRVLEIDGDGTDVELRLEAGGSVRGVVQGKDGSPVVGAVVSLEDPERSQGPRTRVGEDGRFAFEGLALQTYRLRASLDGATWQRTAERVELSRTSASVEVTLTIDADIGTIEGRVVDSSGQGLADVLVSVGAAGRGVTVAATSVLSQPDGSFRVDEVPPGPHTLVAVAPDGASAERPRVQPGEPAVELVLPKPTSASGSIAVGAGALPEVFEVAASSKGKRVAAEVFVSPNGRWTLEGLPPGRLTFAAITAEGRAMAIAELEEGVHRDGLVLELGHRVDVEGRIVDLRSGAPVEGVVVVATAFDDGYEELGKAAEIAVGIGPSDPRQRTDADGRFVVPKVPVGLINIAAFPPGFPESSHDRIVSVVEVPLEDELRLPIAPMQVPFGEAGGNTGIELHRGDYDQPWTIGAIAPDGPAAALGFEPGAAIVTIDSQAVTGRYKYLAPQLLRVPAGTEVTVTLDDDTTARLLAR